MMNKSLTQILVTLFLCVSSAFSLSVSVNQCTGDTDVFKINRLSISCEDEDYCSWGSYGTFTGSYTLGANVATDSPVITAKIWGVSVYNETVRYCLLQTFPYPAIDFIHQTKPCALNGMTYTLSRSIFPLYRYSFNRQVDICDNGSIYNSYGSYCPDSGKYKYVAHTELPGSPNSWYTSFTSWLSFVVYITFDFGDAVTYCEVQIEGQNNASSSSSYLIAGSTMLFVGIVAFRSKKRRIIASEDKQDENQYAERFVEMSGI